jgi:hypothetical protein
MRTQHRLLGTWGKKNDLSGHSHQNVAVVVAMCKETKDAVTATVFSTTLP